MDYREYLTTTAGTHELLEDWRWLIGEKLELWRVTKFGDVFLKEPATGEVHFLDTLEGTVERFAENEEEVAVKLRDEASLDRWLMAGLVDGAAARGMIPGPEQSLSFKVPPQLGGAISLENTEVGDLMVNLSVSGQLRQQIKDLPAGTKVSGVRIVEESAGVPAQPPAAAKTPWWKRMFK